MDTSRYLMLPVHIRYLQVPVDTSSYLMLPVDTSSIYLMLPVGSLVTSLPSQICVGEGKTGHEANL